MVKDIKELEHFVELNRDGVKRLRRKIRTIQKLKWSQSSQAIDEIPNPDFVNHLPYSQYLRKNRQRAERLSLFCGEGKSTSFLLRKVQSLEASAFSKSNFPRDLLRLLIILVLQSTTSESEHQNSQKTSPTKPSGHDNSYFEILKSFLVRAQDLAPKSSFTILDAIICRDIDNNTLLHLAVIAGSPSVTDLLLSYCVTESTDANNSVLSSSLQRVIHELLPLAIRSNWLKIVQLLLKYTANINYAEPSGASFLYIASRFSHEEVVRMLLTTKFDSEIDIEVSER